MEKLIIVGCGGFGREVLDVVNAINNHEPAWDVLGFTADGDNSSLLPLLAERNQRLLGGIDAIISAHEPAYYVIGIGSTTARAAIAEKFDAAGWRAATLIHPTATFGSKVTVGEGSVICAGVRLTTNITLGKHVHLNLNATVGHDVIIDDFVSVNPLVAISGWVHLGRCVTMGTHSAILEGRSVGENSTVGAAACVVKDVANDVIVKGVPAR